MWRCTQVIFWRKTLECAFATLLLGFNMLVVGKVLLVLRVAVRLVGLGFRCRVVQFCARCMSMTMGTQLSVSDLRDVGRTLVTTKSARRLVEHFKPTYRSRRHNDDPRRQAPSSSAAPQSRLPRTRVVTRGRRRPCRAATEHAEQPGLP